MTSTAAPTDVSITSLTNPDVLDNHLAPYGFTSKFLGEILLATGAVVAGGAVTHYLSGSRVPLPAPSDIDLWVHCPMMKYSDAQNHREEKMLYFQYKAFRALVEERVMKSLGPLGYTISVSPMKLGFTRDRRDEAATAAATATEEFKAYMDAKETFRNQDVNIRVDWITHSETNRSINLIFTDRPIWHTVMRFDIPMCRAVLCCESGKSEKEFDFSIQYSPVVMEDLSAGLLTPPVPELTNGRTPKRLEKYLSRYSMKLRA